MSWARVWDTPIDSPPQPSGLWAEGIGNKSIWVEWEPATNKPVAEYRVYRGTTPTYNTNTYTLAGTVDASLTQFTDINRDIGVTYYYTVIAKGTNGKFSLPLPPDAATVENEAPVITSGDDVTTTTTSATVAVTATDEDNYLNPLSYAWAVVSKPDGAGNPAFNSPSAASSLVTFDKAGYYELGVAVSDGDLDTEYTVGVDVQQTADDVTITPQSTVHLSVGHTQQFTAAVEDQFGDEMDASLVRWSAPRQTIDADSGKYTAPPFETDYVTATAGAKSDTVDVKMTLAAPGSATAGTPNGHDVNVTWAETPGATGYRIAWWKDGGQTLVGAFNDVPPNATGWTIPNLSDGKTFEFRVYAKAGELTSDAKSAGTVTTDTVPTVEWFEGISSGTAFDHPDGTATIKGLVPGRRYHLIINFGAYGTWDGNGPALPSGEVVGPDSAVVKLDGGTIINGTIVSDSSYLLGFRGDYGGPTNPIIPYDVEFTASSTTSTVTVETDMIDYATPWNKEYDYEDVKEGWSAAISIAEVLVPSVSLAVPDAYAWEVPLEDTDSGNDELVFEVSRTPLPYDDDGDNGGQGGSEGRQEEEEDNSALAYPGPLTVELHLPAGLAVNGTDYTGYSQTVVIPDGEPSARVTLMASADDEYDPGELVELCIKASSAYRINGVNNRGAISDLVGNIGFNNDNGPASDPKNALLPGTPDAGFAIDIDDEQTEDTKPFRFWSSKDTGGAAFTTSEMTELAPFVVDLPTLPPGVDLIPYIRIRGLNGSKVYVYPNTGNARLDYLSSPIQALQIANASQQSGRVLSGSDASSVLLSSTHEALGSGHHEFLIRLVGSGQRDLDISLELRSSDDNQIIALDRAYAVFRDGKDFYSVVSSRNEPQLPKTYATENGRTEIVDSFSYKIKRDMRNPHVKSTAIFLHGFNNDTDQAEEVFTKTFQRMYFQGLRGNFIGWDWDGDLTGNDLAEGLFFSRDTDKALHTSAGLLDFIQRLEVPIANGGWGLSPKDVDIVAHSLGNVVMWDALRLNTATTSRKLVHNVTSIEAAIFEEAFDPTNFLRYTVPWSKTHGTRLYGVFESVSQQQQSGWRSWFNPQARNIKSSVAGKIINSYNAADFALSLMRLNERILARQKIAERQAFYSLPPIFRSANNLSSLTTYIGRNSSIEYDTASGKWDFDASDLNQAIGTKPNPIASVNINAYGLGWDARSHADFKDKDFPEVWPWWDRVVQQEQAVATGTQ